MARRHRRGLHVPQRPALRPGRRRVPPADRDRRPWRRRLLGPALRVRALRPCLRGGSRRARHSQLHPDRSGPDAGRQLLHPRAQRRGGHRHHRQPQPVDRQRLQGQGRYRWRRSPRDAGRHRGHDGHHPEDELPPRRDYDDAEASRAWSSPSTLPTLPRAARERRRHRAHPGGGPPRPRREPLRVRRRLVHAVARRRTAHRARAAHRAQPVLRRHESRADPPERRRVARGDPALGRRHRHRLRRRRRPRGDGDRGGGLRQPAPGLRASLLVPARRPRARSVRPSTR
jgi:hypothetical protein